MGHAIWRNRGRRLEYRGCRIILLVPHFTKCVQDTRENSRPLQNSKFDFGQRFPINNDDMVSSDIRQFGLMPACISYSGRARRVLQHSSHKSCRGKPRA